MLRFRFLCCVLLCAAPALLGGCLVFPRIDISSPADPHTWYQDVPLAGGEKARFGVDTASADYRPCVMRVGPEGKPVWRKSFARFGEGGHGIFTAGAALRDGTILAAGAESTQTTLAVVAFGADGRVRWGREFELPVQAAGNAAMIATEDGAIVTVPLSGRGDLPRAFVARISASAAAMTWSVTVSGIATLTKTLWSAPAGVTLFAPAAAKPEGAQILARVGPDGDLRWMLQIDQIPRRLWYSTALALGPDGGVIVAGSSGDCPACKFSDAVLARFDGDGAPRWGLTVHRPLQPRRDEDGRIGYLTSISAMLQIATLRDDGSAALALTFPGPDPKSPIAVLDVAEDGRVRSQRAFDASTGAFKSIEVRGPDIVLEADALGRCVLRPSPQKSTGCGTREWDPALSWEPLKLDVSPFQPSVRHPSPKARDLGKELSLSEKQDI